MSGKKGQKKRFWSDEEKRSICGQTSAPDVSVALVARRYSMNANLIHKWLRDPRFSPGKPDDNGTTDQITTFLPIEIEGTASPASFAHLPISAPEVDNALCADRVDITLSDGRRILVEGATALTGVLALVEGLGT